MAELVARGIRFHLQRLGKGRQTVVFLHGLVMDNLSSWYFTVANAAAADGDREVLLYDLRGHGKSERPPGGYAVEEMVADLAAILDGLGIAGPVHLVGNSFGGLLALAFALAHPRRTGSLVLVDGHLRDAAWGKRMAATLSLQGEERDRMIARSFASWLGRHSDRKRNRLAHTAEALVYGTSLIEDLRRSGTLEEAALATIRAPLLAIYGADSDVLAQGRTLARLVPSCELRIYPGCTHSVLWEATGRVRDEILAWLAGRR